MQIEIMEPDPIAVAEKINMVVVNDQPIVRSGLVKILSEEPSIEVTSEASGYEDLFAFLRTAALKHSLPDVVLLDQSNSTSGGFEILGELKRFYPSIRVLMLSMTLDDLYAVRAMRAGAAGYITRESATDELVTAIRQVYAKGKYVTPALAKKLIDSMDFNDSRPEHEKLSNRELQVLSLIAKGKKMKDIAEQLSLSPATIATYRARILEKMKLKSNVELANYAVRHNLI
jgi:two-component system, NarL family, invasion response regulator UvrY